MNEQELDSKKVKENENEEKLDEENSHDKEHDQCQEEILSCQSELYKPIWKLVVHRLPCCFHLLQYLMLIMKNHRHSGPNFLYLISQVLSQYA